MTQDANSLAGRSLIQVDFTCRDLERAKGFYRDVLGLPFLFEVSGMLFFQLAGTRLMVGLEHTKGQPISGSILYFDAPDIHKLGAALEAKGVTLGGPAHVLQRTTTHELMLRPFADPDGNALALMGMVPVS